MDNSRPGRVLFIDDDKYGSSSYVRLLEAALFDVTYVHSVRKAIRVTQEDRRFDAVVIDIMMPPDGFFDALEAAGGYRTGVALAKELGDVLPTAALVALTNSRDADVQAWFSTRDELAYYYKGDTSPEEFPAILKNRILGVLEMPSVFIVHGHDKTSALALKNYLQNVLGLAEPTILAEKPSRGMTLIEKLEAYAQDADLVFALFTPDDFNEPQAGSGRARQNVVFEYGYFMGLLGRRSGRVFFLYKEGVEVPSDLRGVVSIDITHGVEAAGEELRRELRGLIPE